jgi:Uma2 family endonuclease
MAVQLRQRVTLIEFERFVERPENADKSFEYIAGEIVEVPSNPFVSKIAMLIGAAILFYLREHDLGHVTGEAGGYMIAGERYAPDVAFISYERQPELAEHGYNPNPPELAVEVISDASNPEEQRRLRFKLASYLAAGVMVWVVNTEERLVEIHQAGAVSRELNEQDTLTAESILPGFKLAVQDIFPKART